MPGAITPDEIRKTAIDVIVKPASFYYRMSKTGGLLPPILFIVAMGVVTALLILVASSIGLWGSDEISGRPSLGMVILIPLMGILGSFIGAVIMMVIWKMMGSSENFETSFRCVAYSTAIWPLTVILGLIPYVGAVIGTIWSLWLMICASTGAHNISYRKALIVFGILGAIWIFVSVYGQYATNQFQEKYGEEFRQLQKTLEDQKDMTPEQRKEKVNEFLREIQEKKRAAED